MKYTVHGFSQKYAVEVDLDSDDLLILRWFVDFKDSGNMRSMVLDDEKYYWVYYKKIMDELPVLKMKKDAIYRRLKKLCDLKILKKRIVFFGGNYTYYALGSNYIYLISRVVTKPKVPNSGECAPLRDEIAPIPDDFEPIVDDFAPTSGDFSPIADESAPIPSDILPIADDFEPIPSDFEPIPSDFQPIVDESAPTPSDFQPIVDDFEPIPSDFEPTADVFAPKGVGSNENAFSNKPTVDAFAPRGDDLKPTQIINLSNKSIKLECGTRPEFILSNIMWNFIKIKNPTFNEPDFVKWADTFGLILNNDKRNFQEVHSLMRWIYVQNEFWASQILSPKDLRKKYEKILAEKTYAAKKAKQNDDNIVRSIFGDCDLSEFKDL